MELEKSLKENLELKGVLISPFNSGISINLIKKGDNLSLIKEMDRSNYIGGVFEKGSLLEAIDIFYDNVGINLNSVFIQDRNDAIEREKLKKFEGLLHNGYSLGGSSLGVDLRLYIDQASSKFIFETGFISSVLHHRPELFPILSHNSSSNSFYDAYINDRKSFYDQVK